MKLHELPHDFKRFWRISLTGKGYRDEYVEVLGYTPEDLLRIRYLRDDLVEEVSPYSVFPISNEEHARLAVLHPRDTAPAQLDLFEGNVKRGDTSAIATSATPTTFTTI